jgi:phosphate starvation-inducible protein PhoH and related proteins
MARKAPQRGKTKRRYDENVIELEAARTNIKAQKEGPRKKSWSVHDLKAIKPLNESQRMLMESYFMGNHVVAAGSAGTGKSFLALYMALNTIFSKEFDQDKVIIVRSIVTTGKDIGALPGELHEKLAPYEAPYRDICARLTGKPSAYDDMKDSGKLEFQPTTFVRGLTWDNAVVIIDEIQNNSLEDISSVITRLGENSRLIVCGDGAQNDLVHSRTQKSGFADMLRIFKQMESVDVVFFSPNDIVRSGMVREWLMAKEELKL